MEHRWLYPSGHQNRADDCGPSRRNDLRSPGRQKSLFSKRARKYKELGLKDKNLSEVDIRQLIIDEYTFLKRPVLVLEDQIFIGNSKKVVDAAAAALA